MFEDETFLINLHATYPALENFEYDGNDHDPPASTWNTNILPSVLEFLGSMKSLSISDCVIVFHQHRLTVFKAEEDKWEIEDVETCLQSFEKAFDIIEKKFPMETTEIEIHDEEYGFWIKKEKGKPPMKYILPALRTWMSQNEPENNSTEPPIQEIVSAGPGE